MTYRVYRADYREVIKALRDVIPPHLARQELRLGTAYMIQMAKRVGSEECYTLILSITPDETKVTSGIAKWQYTVYFDNLDTEYMKEEISQEFAELDRKVFQRLDSAFQIVVEV